MHPEELNFCTIVSEKAQIFTWHKSALAFAQSFGQAAAVWAEGSCRSHFQDEEPSHASSKLHMGKILWVILETWGLNKFPLVIACIFTGCLFHFSLSDYWASDKEIQNSHPIELQNIKKVKRLQVALTPTVGIRFPGVSVSVTDSVNQISKWELVSLSKSRSNLPVDLFLREIVWGVDFLEISALWVKATWPFFCAFLCPL